MAKRMKFDEASDSDELQALFDSIASSEPAPAPAPPKMVTPPVASAAASNDNDELQSLFDAVAAEFETPAVPAAAAPVQAQAVEVVADAGSEVAYNRIGQLTRQVHDTLRELGVDSALQEVAQAMPDARQRLTYIAQMTEQAASRVLNATDIAKPIQDRIEVESGVLQARWDRLYANQLSVDEFKALVAETRSFIGNVADSSRATNAQLLEIMMAQDFQDLTGQVIKKVVDMAHTLETQLLQVLIEVAPPDVKIDKKSAGLMNGPVVSSEGRDDVVTTQGQVDDLLESLGF